MSDLQTELISIVGEKNVLTGEELASRNSGFGAHNLGASILVRPGGTQEVSDIMKLCNAMQSPVVTHGGLTGLVGGSFTKQGDVILSMERMNEIEEIDPIGRTMTVQCGAILQTVQEAADAQGMLFPQDLGARGSCTIGGNISTNAGGNRVIRYGMTRNSILGLEVVLADGTVISSLNRMIKNNAGYDLKQMFIGAEGTLGIVTRAVLRLMEKPYSEQTAIVAVDDYEKLTGLLKMMDRRLGGTLSSFEVMWNTYYALNTELLNMEHPPLPTDHKYYVIVEALGADEAEDAARFEKAMEQAFEEGLLADGVIAQSKSDRDNIWKIREEVLLPLTRYSSFTTFDISLPIQQMNDYVDEVTAALSSALPDHVNLVFGHLGDGNLHFNVVAKDHDGNAKAIIEKTIYERLAPRGGSVSAEHGVGIEKKPYLYLCRSKEEIALMRSLKSALDPQNILNAGKIF